MKDKLVKLLNLTRSSNDSEALSAIRKANDLVDQCDSSWLKLLGITPQSLVKKSNPTTTYAEAKPTETVKKKHTGEDIELMLDACDDSNAFILSLKTWYDDKGFLTQKQYDALLKQYEKETDV